MIEELQRSALGEPGPLEVCLGEHGVDRAIDFGTVRHEGGEAIR
jgi:hypothetical protein